MLKLSVISLGDTTSCSANNNNYIHKNRVSRNGSMVIVMYKDTIGSGDSRKESVAAPVCNEVPRFCVCATWPVLCVLREWCHVFRINGAACSVRVVLQSRMLCLCIMVHRIGQTKPVTIYRLVINLQIDELISQSQRKKENEAITLLYGTIIPMANTNIRPTRNELLFIF